MTELQSTEWLSADSSVDPMRVSASGDWVLAHYSVLEKTGHSTV
ncbi:Uncharacterised protein [Budvicia aquatica]|uniref:Uncharacterized protein n=1 Tax=Budvicia aquatica TaxID=82979 RepID=A0A484ZM16_9GAMM|nr:Uncharacterised protein [Budvicia aquatica]